MGCWGRAKNRVLGVYYAIIITRSPPKKVFVILKAPLLALLGCRVCGFLRLEGFRQPGASRV